MLLAGLCRAAVMTAIADEQAGLPMPTTTDRLLVGAGYAAARHGLSADVVDPWLGGWAPARAVLAEMMTTFAPALEAAGDHRLVETLLATRLCLGSGADRQRALWRRGTRDRLRAGHGESRGRRPSLTTRDQVAAGCCAEARHCVGLTPKRWRNHREKALGAVNPSSCETSVMRVAVGRQVALGQRLRGSRATIDENDSPSAASWRCRVRCVTPRLRATCAVEQRPSGSSISTSSVTCPVTVARAAGRRAPGAAAA